MYYICKISCNQVIRVHSTVVIVAWLFYTGLIRIGLALALVKRHPVVCVMCSTYTL